MKIKESFEPKWFNSDDFECLPKEQKKIEKEVFKAIRDILKSPERKLGEGFTSVVYFPEFNDQICFKIIKDGHVVPGPKTEVWHVPIDREANFISEARKLEDQVKTPSPVAVLHLDVLDDNGTHDELEVLVMTRLEGMSLEDLFISKKALPEKFDIEKFMGALRSFNQRLHDETGIFHRDLHPKNIFIDNKGQPGVIDFGSASNDRGEPYVEELSMEKVTFPLTDEDLLDKVEFSLREYKKYLED